MKYKYHNALDIVLVFLSNHNELNPISDVDLFSKLTITLSQRDRRILLEKLVKDGTVSKIDNVGFYITFDGLLLLESKGYVKQQKQLASQRCLLSIQTWVIAVGAGLAGIYSVVQLWKGL